VSAAQAQRVADLNLARCTVLVIEDHPDSRDLLVTVLRNLRAHVLTARNIEEAELELQSVVVSLIICDMKLPDGTGYDFIKWLRAQRGRIANTPCIAVTGFEQHFPPNMATGFDAYMRKPINLDKFCDVAVAIARR
jgi:two-component system, OmpR family, response regulator